jgi:alkaline phosphatase D
VAGPLHAGTFGPGVLDPTFGPEARFIGIPAGMKPNRPPSAGFQFFGTLRVEAKTQVLTAQLHDLTGKVIYTTDLLPAKS